MNYRNFINIVMIVGIVIIFGIGGYFVFSRLMVSSLDRTEKIEKESIIEYIVSGGIAGIGNKFIVNKNGCFDLNWDSGLIKGNLDSDKLGSIKQVFEDNDFLSIDYNPGQSVSDDFYVSLNYDNGKNSNNVVFGIETLRHYKPNRQISNIITKLDSVINEIIKDGEEKTNEGYLNVEVRENVLHKWIFYDNFNLEQLLSTSTVIGKTGKIRTIKIKKENIPDKIHQYFISEYSQKVEEKMRNGDSTLLGITGGGLYFQQNKVYGVSASLEFDDYKENKISSLDIYDEIILQWPDNIDIPLISGKHFIKGDIYNQVKVFTGFDKSAYSYRLLENNSDTYIITLEPKLDTLSLDDNSGCR